MSVAASLGWKTPPLFLVDGHAFIHRGFHAYPDFRAPDGFPTSALFFVFRVLLKILREEDPTHIAFVMEGRGPTFRHERFPAYKAGRPAMAEDLAVQIPAIREAVAHLGIPVLAQDGCEADDVLASLAARFAARRVVLVGADKDLCQCLGPSVVLWDPAGRGERITQAADVLATHGVTTAQWPDFQALTGDSVDNIPGVPRVGPKTAARWLRQFPDLESLCANLHQLSPKDQKLLSPHMEDVFVYRELTTLRTDCVPEITWEDLARSPMDPEKVAALVQRFGFRSLEAELQEFVGFPSAPRQGPAPAARTLASWEDLPDLSGQAVALWREDDVTELAAGEHLWRVPGPPPRRALDQVRGTVVSSKALRRAGWEMDAWAAVWDVELMAYLLDPEARDYSWPRLAGQLLGDTAAVGARAVARAGEVLQERLEAAGLTDLYLRLELPLVRVLVAMEARGIALDRARCANLLEQVEARLEDLTQRIYAASGTQFNIRSSQQLAQVLYDQLGLPAPRKTAGGARSTAVEALEAIRHAHPVVEMVLEFRMLEKLRSTYLVPLPAAADATDRIHTTFNHLATATGRLSSSDPNLQNIPIRGPLGAPVRACFVAPPGKTLIAADYSQIELRVLAHLSADPALTAAFAQGEDIHTRTASLLFDLPPEAVGKEERRRAKTINFGLLYGMGPAKLARELGITQKEAKAFIARYFEKLGGVREFYSMVEESARRQGYVLTLAGRRRLLPGMTSANPAVLQAARRMAVNTVVQGSAADIIKMAMLQVEEDATVRQLGGALLLQVHDELVLEAPTATAQAVGERVAAIMTSVVSLQVPLAVDFGIGPDWAAAHG
jgi:DNA polymerase-1